MMIFGDPVTPLQGIGYSIALGGLMYYKLGADRLKDITRQATNSWADYGVRHPILRKLIIFGCVLLGSFILLSGLAPSYGPRMQESLAWNTQTGEGGSS